MARRQQAQALQDAQQHLASEQLMLRQQQQVAGQHQYASHKENTVCAQPQVEKTLADGAAPVGFAIGIGPSPVAMSQLSQPQQEHHVCAQERQRKMETDRLRPGTSTIGDQQPTARHASPNIINKKIVDPEAEDQD